MLCLSLSLGIGKCWVVLPLGAVGGLFLGSEAVMNFCLALNHFLSSPNLFTMTRAGNDARTIFKEVKNIGTDRKSSGTV